MAIAINTYLSLDGKITVKYGSFIIKLLAKY